MSRQSFKGNAAYLGQGLRSDEGGGRLDGKLPPLPRWYYNRCPVWGRVAPVGDDLTSLTCRGKRERGSRLLRADLP